MNPRYRQWSPEQWRRVASTVLEMREQGWQVTAHCNVCDLVMVVQLTTIIQLKGPGFSLWGRSGCCRRRGCHGQMWFQGQPPRPVEPFFLL